MFALHLTQPYCSGELFMCLWSSNKFSILWFSAILISFSNAWLAVILPTDKYWNLSLSSLKKTISMTTCKNEGANLHSSFSINSCQAFDSKSITPLLFAPICKRDSRSLHQYLIFKSRPRCSYGRIIITVIIVMQPSFTIKVLSRKYSDVSLP